MNLDVISCYTFTIYELYLLRQNHTETFINNQIELFISKSNVFEN